MANISSHDLFVCLRDDMQRVEASIHTHLEHTIPLIPQVGGHLILAGGKRLRPLLLLAAAQLCGYEGRDHIKLAVCLEFIHNATLLHDDVMDHSALRRGRPTAHHVWGTEASIVVGDFLLCKALSLMAEVELWPVVHLISQTSTKIIEGQTLDLCLGAQVDLSEAQYLDMIEAKTACLFEAACGLGALLQPETAPKSPPLREFGRLLGLAFQIMDDVLDYTSDAATLGKTPGQDFREGKVTLPVILAFARADAQEKAFWTRCLQNRQQNPDDLVQAEHFLQAHQAFAQARTRAQKYGDQACALLEAHFPDHALKPALAALVDFVIHQV